MDPARRGRVAGRELGSEALRGSNFRFPQHPGPSPHFPAPGFLAMDFRDRSRLLGGLIAVLVISGFIAVILMYVSSVMRFILSIAL